MLGQLYGRYLDLVYGVCLNYLKDGGRAEDATMDIYEQLRVKLQQHNIESFRPWLYRLARNHCLMLLRKTSSSLTLKSKSISAKQTIDLADVQLADISHPEDESSSKEALLIALEDCTETLPANQATCIKRFYLKGESYAELAKSLDWTLGKVRSAIQNGRRNLKRCLERKRAHVEQ